MDTNETPEQWIELRDDRGKLCGRLDAHHAVLEIRRNHGVTRFDLRDHLRPFLVAFSEQRIVRLLRE